MTPRQLSLVRANLARISTTTDATVAEAPKEEKPTPAMPEMEY